MTSAWLLGCHPSCLSPSYTASDSRRCSFRRCSFCEQGSIDRSHLCLSEEANLGPATAKALFCFASCGRILGSRLKSADMRSYKHFVWNNPSNQELSLGICYFPLTRDRGFIETSCQCYDICQEGNYLCMQFNMEKVSKPQNTKHKICLPQGNLRNPLQTFRNGYHS